LPSLRLALMCTTLETVVPNPSEVEPLNLSCSILAWPK